MSINRTTVVNLLKEGTVEIKFTKRDGSLRTLNGTLQDVPVEGSPVSASSLSVLDTDINEYRAFNWESVKSVNGTEVAGL